MAGEVRNALAEDLSHPSGNPACLMKQLKIVGR